MLNEGKQPFYAPEGMSRKDAREAERRYYSLGKPPLKEKEKLRRKERRNPTKRKIATCLGCGKPNHSCICSDHLKPHIETQITYNWKAGKEG